MLEIFKRRPDIPPSKQAGFQFTIWRKTCLTKDYALKGRGDAAITKIDLLNWTAHLFSQSIAVEETWDNSLGRGYLSPKQIGAVGTFLPNELINLINQGRRYTTFIGSLLFADISGFTTLCETYAKFGPEGAFRLTAMLNSYIGAMVDLIYSFGGDLLKFAGDAFIAVWHVRLSEFLSYKVHESISCAMHIQYSLGTYITDVGVMLKVKIAVSAGNFVFSLVGDEMNSSYIIYGFPVLEAKKAESMAESGDTVIAPSAWRFVSPRDYSFEPLPEGYVKMKRILYDPRVMKRKVFDFDARQLVEINIKNETLRQLTEKTDLNSSSMSFEENIRTNLFGVAIRAISEELRPFIIAPVMQQIDANSSFEYLTEMRQVTIMFLTLKPNTTLESGIVKLTDMVYCTISKIVKSKLGLINKVCLFDKDIMFLVIFGMKGFKEKDEALRCLRCAYQIHSALANEELIKSLSIGVTIGTTYCGVVGHPFRKEYTVIGGAVNKAARLMCAYTNMISCDHSVVLNSRLPLAYFTRLPPKHLKGIGHVSNIFRYEEVGLDISKIPPILGRTDILKKFRELLLNQTKFKGLVIMGDPRSGKTRVLSELVEEADAMEWKTIWLSVHSSLKHGICLLHKLFANLLGRTIKDRMASLIKIYARDRYYEYLYVLNDIFDVNFAFPFKYSTPSYVNPLYLFKRTLKLISVKTVILIDDAHGLDTESWSVLLDIIANPSYIVVLSLPSAWQNKDPVIQNCLSSSKLITFYLDALHVTFIPALVCQMLNIEAVPRKLIKVLVKLSKGNPGWVQTFLLSYIEAGNIVIKISEMGSLNTSVYIIPDQMLLHGVSPRASLDPEMQSVQDTEALISVCKIVKALDENALPATFDDVIMSMFDRLSSFEQLLLKCASVLGNSFFRVDLISVMGGPPEMHVAPAMKRLFQLHVLGCAAEEPEAAKDAEDFFKTPKDDRKIDDIICNCINSTEDFLKLPQYAYCKNPEFKFSVFCTTINATIPMNQKIEFHTRALRSIKGRSKKCDSCIENEVAYELSMEDPTGDPAYSKSSLPSQGEKSDSDEEYSEPNLGFTHQERTLGTTIGDFFKKLFRKRKHKKIRELYSIDFPSVMKCTCYKEISETYEQLVHHARMAELLVLELKYLLAFAIHSIDNGKFDKAVQLLKDAENVHEQCLLILNQDVQTAQDKAKAEKKKKAIPVQYMKYSKNQILTYLGMAYMYLGRITHASLHLNLVGRRAFCKPYFYFQVVLMNWPEVPLTYRKKLRRQMVLKTDVYTSLSKTYLVKNDISSAVEMASKGSLCAKATDDIRHRALSYANDLDLLVQKGKFFEAKSKEKSYIKSCLSIYRPIHLEDLICMGNLYTAVFKSRFYRGDLTGCLEPGDMALKIAQGVDAVEAELFIFPKLVIALFLTKNFDVLQDILHPRIYTSEELHSFQHVTKMKMYHRVVLETFMETGLALENPNQMFMFAKKGVNRKHLTMEHQSSRCNAMNIWLWYLRKEEIKRADSWSVSDCWDLDFLQENLYYCMKLIQCNLVWLENKLETNLVTTPRMEKLIVRLGAMFKIIGRKHITKVPYLMPRFLHLRAYFTILTFEKYGSKRSSFPGYSYLSRAYKIADMHGNVLEKSWIIHSKMLWYTPEKVIDPLFWINHLDEDAVGIEDFDAFEWHEILYSFKLPERIQEELKRIFSYLSLPESFSFTGEPTVE